MWPTPGHECGPQGTLTLTAASTLHLKELQYSNNSNNFIYIALFNLSSEM